MSASISVVVDGIWLSSICPWGDLVWSTRANGGSGQASWNVHLPRGYRHPALRRGKRVEIKVGSKNVFAGKLAEPDDTDDGWEFHANGAAVEGAGFLCFDGSLNTTSTPDTAIDQAIARGLDWSRPNSISATAFAANDQTDALNYVSELLDAYALDASMRWGVDADRQVYTRADPTTPKWHMTPGSGVFGLADDEYASDVYLRYYGTDFKLATAHADDPIAADNFGTRELPVDGRNYGTISAAKATSLAQGKIDLGRARLAWTNALDATRYQLTTPGGAPAFLPAVQGGQMVRLFGVRNEQGQPLPYVDFVIGEGTYDSAEHSLNLAPTELAERSLIDVLAGLNGAA